MQGKLKALLIMALLTGKLYADPPGVVYTPQLRQQLEAGLQVLGPGYQPRTEHLSDNGRPLFTNRLILEDSPYLRLDVLPPCRQI